MRIKHLILLFVLLLNGRLYAQFNHISIGGEIDIPSGNAANISSIGLGAGLKGEVGLSPRFALTANGSLVSFFPRRLMGSNPPAEVSVPVKGGLKYYAGPNFYVEGQLGINIPVSGAAVRGFVWSPGLGSLIPLRNTTNKIDVGIRYEGWSSRRLVALNNSRLNTFGFISLRAAYAFGI